MKYSVLVDRFDVEKTKVEEHYFFLRKVLLGIGLPITEVMPEDINQFTVEKKIQYRQLLNKYSLNVKSSGEKVELILSDSNNEAQQIAEWLPPVVHLRTDLDKQLFCQIDFEYSTLVEI